VQASVLGGTVVEGTDAVDAGTLVVVDDALVALDDPHDAISNRTAADSTIRPTPRCMEGVGAGALLERARLMGFLPDASCVWGWRRRLLAYRAEAPEGDLRFVDKIAIGFRRSQARTPVHDAVDVGRGTASTTDDMVMVVADAKLVQGRRARRFQTPDKARVHQGGQHVVDRL
jgi:hypothetical protein